MSAQPALFETHAIRRVYDEKTETWWFSVVDIVQVLTQQPDYQMARKYWNKLKERLGKEGSQLVTNCHQLKMLAADGKAHKKLKGLQDHNLRDHMSEAELIFTALAELSTRQIAETDEATGMAENTEAASKGGAIAKQARKALEAKTGKPVVTGENFLPPAGAAPRKVTKKS